MPKQSTVTTKEITELVQQVREIILSARALAARSLDTALVAMNFAIGQRIVEHEQLGNKWATYGKRVIEILGQPMASELGRGFSATSLWLMRQFYITYSTRILPTLTGESPLSKKFPNDLPIRSGWQAFFKNQKQNL